MAALTAYARPRVSATEWAAELWPLLSIPAQAAYTGTNPSTITAHRVTGPARLTPASLPALARVSVPADDGIYLIVLSRTPEAPRWRVERLIPPETVGR